MENIAADPIIMYYFKLTTEPQDSAGFSEIRLRLALTQILCKRKYHYVLDIADLELYRKVLLLFFSSKYKTPAELHAVMTCFDEETIKLHLSNSQEIIKEWQNFQSVKLICVAHREAATEILKEWHHRLLLCGGKLDEVVLEAQVTCILSFLKWDLKYRRKFEMQIFRFLTDSSTNRQSTEDTPLNLDVEKIYEWLRPNLSSWIVKMIENNQRNSKRPAVPPQTILQQLNRLPVGTTFELEKSSLKQKDVIKRSKKRIIVEVEEVTNKKTKQLEADTIESLLSDDVRAENSTVSSMTQDLAEYISADAEDGDLNHGEECDTEQQFALDENSTNEKISQDFDSNINAAKKEINEEDAVEAVLKTNDQSASNTKESLESNEAEANKCRVPQELTTYLQETEEDIELECDNQSEADFYKSKYSNVIDTPTAMNYIEQLKLYALSRELFEALDPLEQVEEIFK